MSRETQIGVGCAIAFFVLALLVGCTAYKPYDYDAKPSGSLGNDSWQYGNYNGGPPPAPPRPTFGHTYGGRGTWQDLGGGMTSVRDTRTGTTTILMDR